MTHSPDYRLRLLGGASIEGPEGPLTGRVAQRNALALMAVLATTPDHTLPRETITALLWPERETKRARHLLNVTAYEIRKALGEEALTSANGALHSNPAVVTSDVEAFASAVESEQWERAAELYSGPLLDGFHYDGSETFERWVERERWRYERLYRTVLERLAHRAEATAEAATRWRMLLERDPASATATLGLMRALEATGRRAEAIDVAHNHRMLLLDEYGADPNPDVEILADRLREEPIPNGTDTGRRAETTSPDRTPSRTEIRRRSLAVAGAVVVTVGAITLAALRVDTSAEESRDPLGLNAPVTLVVPFENRSGDPALDSLGRMAADWINQGLVETGLLRVVSSAHLRRASHALDREGRPADATSRTRALAEFADADLIVSGALYRHGDSLVFQEQIVRAETGEVLAGIDRLTASPTDPIDALERLRQHTTGRLAAVIDPRLARWTRSASQPPSYEAYSRFTIGLDEYARGEFQDAARSFRAAADPGDGFQSPSVWEALSYYQAMWEDKTNLDFEVGARADSLVEYLAARRNVLPPWDWAMVDYLSAQSDGDIRAAYDAMRRVTRLTPEPRWRIELARYALWLNRPAEAARALEPVDPEDASERKLRLYLYVAVNSHHRLSDFDRELEVARRWRAKFPRSVMARMYELRALGSLGRANEVEKNLDEYFRAARPGGMFLLRELEIHGHRSLAQRGYARALEATRSVPVDRRNERWGMSHARLLYLNGDLRRARAEYERLLRETRFSDNHVPYIGALGRIAARTGDRETALRMSRRLMETDWSEVWYSDLARLIAHQRAQIAALLGEPDWAVRILREAFDDGAIYGEAHIRTMSPDLDLLKDLPAYRRLARPAG